MDIGYWYCWEPSDHIAGMKCRGMVVIEYTYLEWKPPRNGIGKARREATASQSCWIVPGTAAEMEV